MRQMAESTTEMNPDNSGRAWEHSSTRKAILEAARRLAAREGAEAVTLSRVATEAGFAPPAVYAYFVSKDDLHLAVVADDLNTLARAMRGEEVANDGVAESDGTQSEVAPEGEADVIAFHPAAEDDAAPPLVTEEAADPSAEAPGEPTTETSPEAEPQDAGTEVAAEPECADGAVAGHSGEPEFELPLEAAPAEAKARLDLEQTDETPSADLDSDAGMIPAEILPEPFDGAASPGEAAVPVSLAEIEQAIGIVLALPAGDVPEEHALPVEEVPDAFPEEADESGLRRTPEMEEAPAEIPPVHIEKSAAQPGSIRARWRRGRRSGDTDQIQMPLEPDAEAADPDDAATAIAKLQETVARLEARPVDAWLERRLRVFERTLADIESRMAKAEQDSATALSTVSDGFQALEQRFGETCATMARTSSDAEQRQRAAASDVRMYVKDLAGRLSAVESSLSHLLGSGQLPAGPGSDMEPVHQGVAEPVDEESPVDASAESGEQFDHQGDYLAAARAAARSAAAQAETERMRRPLSQLKMAPAHAKGVSVSRRSLQLIAGGLVLIVGLISIGIAMRNNAAAPPTRPVVKPVAVQPAQTADQRIVALAKAGNANAELIAALKLLNGDGVATDIPSAAAWLKRAADQHQPVAEYWLGTLYERGRGVDKDRAQALDWYQRAAEAGNAKAMYRLAVGYAEGWNGQANYVDAAKWFQKAADLGVIDAQYNLAVLYERGSGVPQSFVGAFKWYAIAAAQGDAESKSRIDALATQMSATDVAKAQAEAQKFQPASPDPASNVEPDVSDLPPAK